MPLATWSCLRKIAFILVHHLAEQGVGSHSDASDSFLKCDHHDISAFQKHGILSTAMVTIIIVVPSRSWKRS